MQAFQSDTFNRFVSLCWSSKRIKMPFRECAKWNRLPIFTLISAAALAAMSGTKVQAATYTWTSTSDSSWSNPANWSGGLPLSATTTTLAFGTGSQLTSVNDISGLIVNALTFSGSTNGYSITGNALTFTANGATAPSITQTSSIASSIGTALNWAGTSLGLAGTGNLTLSGVLTGTTSGTTASLAKTGTSRVTLTAAGSSLSGTLAVNGGTLELSGGATLGTGNGVLNSISGSEGTVTVTGVGSQWNNAATLTVGDRLNTTGTMNITDGGAVQSTNVNVGISSTSSTSSHSIGTINVSNKGTLTVTSSLTLGSLGTGVLNISSGGVVSSNGGSVGSIFDSLSSPSIGTVTIDGAGSLWNTSSLSIGNGTVSLTNGGQLTSQSFSLYRPSTSLYATITVDGTGSLWTNASAGTIGASGPDRLQITNGGAVSFTGTSITNIDSTSSNSNGTQVTVDGSGSTWTLGGELDLYSSTLTITNGGVVRNTLGEIGVGARTAQVTVDGSGSTWTNMGRLDIDQKSTLTITNGGVVNAGGSDRFTALQGDLWADGGTLNSTSLIGFGTIHVSNTGLILNLSTPPITGSSFAGKVVDGTAPGHLTILGASKKFLGGANTYSGGTLIGGGTVVASVTGLGTGTVTLQGNAILSVGSSVNTGYTATTTRNLSVSSLIWGAGSTLTFNLGSSGVSDTLTAGALTFSGAGDYRIAFASATGTALSSGVYTLITVNSLDMPTVTPIYTTTGNLANLSGPVLTWQQNGNSWQLILTEAGGNIVMPEPGSLLLALPAVLCAMGIWKRHRSEPCRS